MPRPFSRTQRVAEQIQRELGELVTREIRDPRLRRILISAVRVSRDLAYAKIFVTLEQGVEVQPCLDALAHASGYLRHKLAQRLSLRSLPELRFVHDETLDRASRLTALIDEAVAGDQRPDHRSSAKRQ